MRIGILGSAAAALGALLVFCRVRAKAVLAVILGAMLGALCAFSGQAERYAQQELLDGYQGQCQVLCLQDAKASSYGYSVQGQVLMLSSRRLFAGPRVVIYIDDATLRFGDILTLDLDERQCIKTDKTYLRNAGVCATIRADNFSSRGVLPILRPVCMFRNNVINLITEASTDDVQDKIKPSSSADASMKTSAGAVLAAIVCGFRQDLSGSAIYLAFQRAGLAHLIAISGAHLTIVFALCSLVLKSLKINKRLTLVLQIVMLLTYLCFAAIPLSALRAAVMTFLGIASFFSGRRPATLSALACCIITVIVIHPFEALSISFLLSAISTLSIVLFARLFSSWLFALFPHVPRFIHESCALTLAANLSSLPIGAALFSQCSLISPISNILCAPLFTIVCSCGFVSLIISMVCPVFAGGLVQLSLALTQVLCELVQVLAVIPYACVPASLSLTTACILALAGSLLLWMWWPAPHRRTVIGFSAISIVLILVVAAQGTSATRLIMMDVGQGDAFLIQSGRRTVLIDTGCEDDLLKQALARAHVATIDAAIITHPDNDHCASLDALTQVCTVRTVVVSDEMLSSACGNGPGFLLTCEEQGLAVRGMDYAESLRFGDVSLTAVWPHTYQSCGDNADSLCLLLNIDTDHDKMPDYRALFTGDAGEDELATMLAEGTLCDIDILKVGHHGSKTAMTSDEVAELSPDVALISVGADNRYGHPSTEVLNMLREANVDIFRTDLAGDVIIDFTSQGYQILSQYRGDENTLE